MSPPLVIVANRLPIHHDPRSGWERSPGGLVSALAPIIASLDGTWVGWDDSTTNERIPRMGSALAPFRMTSEERRQFYLGYSNSSLWPMLHEMPERIRTQDDWFAGYLAVNQRVADLTLASAPEVGTTVWIHDYHFLLLPRMLRAARADITIGVFLHTPVPARAAWQRLPDHGELLGSLAEADLVGTQRVSDAENLEDALAAVGRGGRVGAFPISIDPGQLLELVDDPATQSLATRLRRSWGDRHVFLGIDRMDYTKGIPLRLRAFRSLVGSLGSNAAKVGLVQIASPSRESVPEYRAERDLIRDLTHRCRETMPPGTLLAVEERNLGPREVVAHYLAADTLLVTPLRDGMNLVAKEFAVARRGRDGLLVLSRTAGAADELSGAVCVEPTVESVTAAMRTALEMSAMERRRRAGEIFRQVNRSTCHDWAHAFLAALADASTDGREAPRYPSI